MSNNYIIQNRNDKFVVKVLKDNEVVEHMPRDLSKYCGPALLCEETVECVVLRRRENKYGNKLEVPHKYIVKRPKYILKNVESLIKKII